MVIDMQHIEIHIETTDINIRTMPDTMKELIKFQSELKSVKQKIFKEKNKNLEQQKCIEALKIQLKNQQIIESERDQFKQELENLRQQKEESASRINVQEYVDQIQELKDQVIEKDGTVKMVQDLYYMRSTEFTDEIQSLKNEKQALEKEKADLCSKVPRRSTNLAVMGELWLPLSLEVILNMAKFWLRLTEQNNSLIKEAFEESKILSKTYKDNWATDQVALNLIEDACRDCLDKYAEDVSAVARRHISDKYEYFISNTEDNPSVFQLIRQNLLNLATTMRTWNKDYPIKFIQLEKCLGEKKKELPIISFNEIKQISTEIPKPLNHEELMLYLKFHHELRALVYFEDLSDYIILDTQWLSDAFKCIITAEKFQSGARRHLLTDEWNDLNIRGILHSVVLEHILETNKKIFKFEEKQNLFQHKDHILKVMEKFDIIIRPTVSDRDDTDTKPSYYIPCMVKEVPDCPINEQFNVTEKNCTKSTWLCFKFKFLPGHLMNHLIASLSRKYEIAEVPVCGQKKRPIALFRGTVVFELQKTSKLLVKRYPNVIQIQVWDFGKHCNIERCLFKDIDDFVTREIKHYNM
ncbi:unnamed protein product [Mytilus edulis]|uniref:COR domain-containing protein n=1 Tax=Mytilus edulis TaxID=6550 RepID=A0A8S3R610_MYTED|nr:unnamed protein product [Mytilus edulis]